MCLICLEWEKGKLTHKEAKRNLFEMAQTDGRDQTHLEEAWAKIRAKELEEQTNSKMWPGQD